MEPVNPDSGYVFLFLAGIVLSIIFSLKLCDWVRAWHYNLIKQAKDKAFAEGIEYGKKRAVVITPDRPAPDLWLEEAYDELDEIMTNVEWWGQA